MENITIRHTWRTDKLVKPHDLSGFAFVSESQAHTFIIDGFDGEYLVPIGGGISATFLGSTGITTLLSGSIDDGCAVVTLSAECYAVPGQFDLTIYATDNGVSQAIYEGVGVIKRTSTDVISYPTDTVPNIQELLDDVNDAIDRYEEIIDEFPEDIAAAVDDYIDAHPEAVTTVQDGAISKAKLNSELQGVVETVQALNGGRYNQMNYRWHVDCVNGNDNDTGESGHAWRTLDKFFSMANKLDGGRADIRCYLDTPGTYDVQCEAGSNTVFTGVALHITGGLDSDAAYDGKYIIRFLTTRDVKWYESHVNLRNVRIECPNSTVDAPFAFDGGCYEVANCYINTRLDTYHAGVNLIISTIKNIVIHGGDVLIQSVKTLLTSGPQITIVRGAIVTYVGSINNEGLIKNSTYPAFNVTASFLYLTQVYPDTIGPSLQCSNAVLIATAARATSWKNKAGTFSNSFWVTG